MSAFSLFTFKQIVCRRSFRLMCNALAPSQSLPLFAGYYSEGDSNPKYDQTRQGISFTTKYLNQSEGDNIQWDDLLKKLGELNVENPSTKILQACARLNKYDTGIQYYNYLTEKGVNLSSIELMFFCKLLVARKSEIKKHEQLLLNLYKDVQVFLESSSLVRKFLMEVFVEIPSCFKEIVKNGIPPGMRGGFMPVVEKALELNMLEEAFQFMQDYDFTPTTTFVDSYINFCIKRAEEGKFSNDYLNRLIDFCAERAVTMYHTNLIDPLRHLATALNKYQDEYHWSVSSCAVNDLNVCSCCFKTLIPRTLTEEEFELLKESFYKSCFVESKVYLNTTKPELEKFLTFLENSQPYNVVLDGLNLWYKHKTLGIQMNNRHLKYFLDQNFKVLTIGRIHSKTNLTKGKFLSNPKYRKNAQFFFTSNVSDDDCFLMYAALYRGKNTCLVTGDFLGKYASRLTPEVRCLFLKWQMSHQYLSTQDMDLYPPLSHCGLSQLTVSNDEEHIWHFSQQVSQRPKINYTAPINWYCLRAVKKGREGRNTLKQYPRKSSKVIK